MIWPMLLVILGHYFETTDPENHYTNWLKIGERYEQQDLLPLYMTL
mgnify:FL=1